MPILYRGAIEAAIHPARAYRLAEAQLMDWNDLAAPSSQVKRVDHKLSGHVRRLARILAARITPRKLNAAGFDEALRSLDRRTMACRRAGRLISRPMGKKPAEGNALSACFLRNGSGKGRALRHHSIYIFGRSGESVSIPVKYQLSDTAKARVVLRPMILLKLDIALRGEDIQSQSIGASLARRLAFRTATQRSQPTEFMLPENNSSNKAMIHGSITN